MCGVAVCVCVCVECVCVWVECVCGWGGVCVCAIDYLSDLAFVAADSDILSGSTLLMFPTGANCEVGHMIIT